MIELKNDQQILNPPIHTNIFLKDMVFSLQIFEVLASEAEIQVCLLKILKREIN